MIKIIELIRQAKIRDVLFWLLTLIFLYPIWSLPYFPTLDGPAHIYNGHVLSELLLNKDSFFHQFFVVNPYPIPYWFSQVVLGVLTHFFDPFDCEKICLSLYIIWFVTGFKSWINSVKDFNGWLSLLAFVFVYNTTFLYGFYNYNFGIAFLFFAIAAYNKFCEKSSWYTTVKLAFLAVLLYFSHLVIILVFGLYVFIHLIGSLVSAKYKKEVIWWFNIRVITRLVLAFFLPVFLTCWYVFTDKESSSFSYLTSADIWKQLQVQAGNFCINNKEAGFTRWNTYVLMAGLVMAVVFFLFGKWKSNFRLNEYFSFKFDSRIVIIYGLALAILLFILPDGSAGGGGILTIRLIWLTTTFIIVAIFTFIRIRALLIAMILVLCIVNVDKVFYVRNWQNKRQYYSKSIDEAMHVVDGEGLLVFFDYHSAPLQGHNSKVLGMKDPLIALDALNAHKIFAGVQWKGTLRNDEKLGCWLGEQWRCNTENLPMEMNNQDIYFYVNGFCGDSPESQVNCEEWNTFFNDKAVLLYSGERDIRLYKYTANNK